MKARRIITLSRFAALFLVAGAVACGGDMEPEPDPNRAPVAVGSIPPLTLTEGESTTVDVSQLFSDPDGDQLTYSATSSDNSVLTVSVSGSNVTATAVAEGTVDVTITATDPDGLSASQSISVMVQAANQAPVVTDTIPAQTLTEGDTVTIDADNYFSDPDGDALTFSASSSDTDAATASVDGSVVTLVAVAEGTATVTVTATDPQAASAMQEFTVTVEPGNRAPVAVGEIPPLILPEGEGFTAPVSQFFTDPDGDSLTYAATVSDTAVATVSMSGSMITVMAVAEGMATITVTATDPGGLSATQTTTITVVSVNQAPMLTDTIPHQDMMPGDTITLDLSNHFTDPDGDTLSFAAETDDTAVATVAIDGSMVTVVAVGPGSAFITVAATDPDGASAAQTFAASVATGNRAPMAVGEIAAQTVAVGDSATVDVSGNFSDPDDDDLTYTAASSDEGAVTVSVSGAMVTVAGVAAGSATVTVTATDAGDLSATQTFDVTVSAGNQAPEISDAIPHQGLTVRDTLTLDAADHFSDPNGDPLTFTAESDDTTVAKVSVDGSMVTIVIVRKGTGSAFVSITATDPGGLSATQVFAATPVPYHDLLWVPDTLDVTVADTMTTVVFDMAAYFTNPGGDELTYTASTSDEAIATVESVEGSVVTTVAVSSDTSFAHDTTTLTVTATDPDGVSMSRETKVLVANSDYAPWDPIELLDDGTIKLTAGLTLTLSECTPFDIVNFPFGTDWVTIHWTAWQVKKGDGWLMIPGTYNELNVCAYTDLATAPDGTYRLVGELSIRPSNSTEDDFVRSRATSKNEIVKTGN